MTVVAITGTSESLGAALLSALLNETWCKSIIALDSHPPISHTKVQYHPVDLANMQEEKDLGSLLRGADSLVHAALPTRPMRNLEKSHELQSVGTMYLLHACAQARIPHLVLASTTQVYGANPNNPNYLSEDFPRHARRGNPFLRDKVEVEEQFEHYSAAHPKARVAILRACTILGRGQFLQQRVIPTVMGYDPLIQLVHEHDVVRIYLQVIQKQLSGTYNIVGDGVMPLSQAIAMAGKTACPLPSPLLYVMSDLLWQSNISPMTAENLNFLKYNCVADGARARKELGFTPVYNTREALLAFLDANRMEE